MDTNQTPSASFPATFNPADPAKVLDDFNNPDLSFRGVADENGTTMEALALWARTPEIRRRLRAMRSIIVERNADKARDGMLGVIKALQESVSSYYYEETHHPINRANLSAVEQRRRSRETMIRAAKILHHISTPRNKPRSRHRAATPTNPLITTQPLPVFTAPRVPKRINPYKNIPADAFHYEKPILNNKPATSLANAAGAAP